MLKPETLQKVAAEADFQPKTMAAICHVSLSDLEAHFRTVFKQTPGQWMREVRSHSVLRLLAEGHKLEKIATMLKFANSSHLSNEFRRVHSAPPRKVLTSLTRRATGRQRASQAAC